VSTTYVLRAAVSATRTHRGLEELDATDFLGLLRDKMNLVEMDQTLLHRAMNEGVSGGEKKRSEILQMAVLDPKLAILDEPDSGLDIDTLRIVATGINGRRGPDRDLIVITHYQRLLNYIAPDVVHVLFEHRIVKSGVKQLALVLEQQGSRWIEEQVNGSEAVRSYGGTTDFYFATFPLFDREVATNWLAWTQPPCQVAILRFAELEFPMTQFHHLVQRLAFLAATAALI
jgi:Fe-S cluster assembly ATP-binding protein